MDPKNSADLHPQAEGWVHTSLDYKRCVVHFAILFVSDRALVTVTSHCMLASCEQHVSEFVKVRKYKMYKI